MQPNRDTRWHVINSYWRMTCRWPSVKWIVSRSGESSGAEEEAVRAVIHFQVDAIRLCTVSITVSLIRESSGESPPLGYLTPPLWWQLASRKKHTTKCHYFSICCQIEHLMSAGGVVGDDDQFLWTAALMRWESCSFWEVVVDNSFDDCLLRAEKAQTI